MDITPEVISDFRDYFDGRYGSVIWCDDLLRETLCAADFETGGSGWGAFEVGNCKSFKRRGMYLYAAAYLTSFYGDDPTQPIANDARLNVAAKSVGDESIQYRVSAMQDAGNDFLTYTLFGQEFFRIRKQAYTGARAL